MEPGKADFSAIALIVDIFGCFQLASGFPTLQNLIVQLATAGFQTRFNITLFVKSQITIAGILLELDPDFDQDAYMLNRV